MKSKIKIVSTSPQKIHRALFLDRDGTVNFERHYLNDVKKFKLFKGVVPAVKKLHARGWKIFIGTNQSGIAHGYVKIESLRQIHDKLLAVFKAGGVRIDGVYFCPHGPDQGCVCRKPAPGMIRQAQKKFKLDLANSFVVGDRKSDILWGQQSGLRSILVLTGYGRSTLAKNESRPDFVARSLPWAIEKILSLEKLEKSRNLNKLEKPIQRPVKQKTRRKLKS